MSKPMRWVDIDTQAAVHNLSLFRAAAPRVLAVVKSECYGHGRELGRVFEEAGADWLGVATLEEGLAFRRDGRRLSILVFGQIRPERVGEASAADITLEVGSREFAEELSREAAVQGVTVDCHLKLDTGMGRIGFDVTRPDAVEQIEKTVRLPGLRFTGAFQHFCVADDANPEADAFTRLQFSRFQQCLSECAERGITFPLRHCCNSAAAIRFPEFHLDMVRAGVSLYGLPAGDAGLFGTKPVLSWRAEVTQVKEVLPGQSVSYGRDFVAKEPTLVATVALGYADGYRRGMAGSGAALVHGKRVPVIGRVCMDQLMLDVTGLEVRSGDTATFIGRDGDCELTCQEMSDALGTIPYEVVCLIGERCPRLLF